jgi:hypothetical protein
MQTLNEIELVCRFAASLTVVLVLGVLRVCCQLSPTPNLIADRPTQSRSWRYATVILLFKGLRR